MRRSSGLSHCKASPEGTAIRAMKLWTRLHTEERSAYQRSLSLLRESRTLQWREKASTVLSGFLYSFNLHRNPVQ